MVHVVFQSVFRVAYKKTHFSVFVMEVVFEWRLYLNFKVTHPEQLNDISPYFNLQLRL